MSKGLIYTHQGWTDIINCLPIINFYSSKFEKLVVVSREDSKKIMDYYLSQFENVQPEYVNKDVLDYNLESVLINFEDYEKLFIGVHDRFRTDIYQNKFLSENTGAFFVKKFYSCYGIDYSDQLSLFDLNRNLNLENEVYIDFINEYGKDYVLCHSGGNNIVINTSYNIVELDKRSEIFFDYIKVLQNAKEIHLLDSSWAAICYLLDGKFGILSNIKVFVHCLRGYQNMFDEPTKLPNWVII